MATTPLWSEVEAQPWFSTLTPEQKSQSLKSWTTDALNAVKTPEERLVVEAASDARSKFFAGAPMPENMGEYVQTYAQQKAQQEVDAQAKEKADRPFFGFGDTLNALGTIASNLPTNVKAAAYQLKEGLAMPSERSQGYLDAMAEKRAADEAVQADQAQREAQGLATSVGSAGREFSNSSGFSGVAMGAAFAGGEAGAAVGTPIGAALGAGAGGAGAVPGAGAGALVGATVGAIGGLVSSGAAAYRMAGATFLDDAFDMANKQSIEEKGRPLSKEEEKSLYDQVLPIAQNTALWEAGPEAIGNVFTMGVGKFLFKGIGKEALQQAGTSLATRALATGTAAAGKAPVSATRNLLNKAGLVAADVGVELAGETATQVGGQGWDQAKLEALLAGKNPADVANPYAGAEGIAKGFEEIAPATLFGSALMGGGAGLVGLAKEQYVKAQAAKAQEIADTASSLIQVGAPQTSAALVQTAVEVASAPPAEVVAPAPSEEKAPPTPIETQENAPTQERQVESPSGTPPIQSQPVIETATGQVEEGTPPRQGQGEVTTIKVAAKPAVMARSAATPEVRVTAAPTPTQVEETFPAATTVKVAAKPTVLPKPAKAPEVRVAPVQGYPRQALKDEVGKSIAQWSSGDLAAFDAFVRTGDSETIAKLGAIKRQVANRVGRTLGVTIAEPKRIGVPGVAKQEPSVAEVAPTPDVVTDPARRQEITNSLQEGLLILKTKKNNAGKRLSASELAAVQRSVDSDKAKLGIAVKEAPVEAKPKSYRRTSRFDNNPNTGKPDILNFVADYGMVVPSAKLKAAEKKAGKSVGGERDPLRDVELDEGEKTKVWRVSNTTIPFDAQTIDKVAQAAFNDNLISAPTADALIEKMVEASKERKAGKIEDQQQAILDDREAQTKAFDEAVTTPAKDKERIASSEVVVGNKYTILGEEFTVTEITYDEADGTPIGLVLTSPTFGAQKASLEEPFYVTKKEAPKKQAGLESLLEGTESTRPKNKGETAKPQAADPLAELGAATRAGKAEQDQGKMELPPAAETPQLTERQKARVARNKVTKEKLDDLATRRQAAADKFRKSMGQTNAGLDPTQFAAAFELAKISAETGAVKFMDFAQDVRDQFPDLWNNIKDYLSGVWNQLALENEELEEAPSPREARKLMAQIEAEETPVVVEEVQPVTEEISATEETPVVEEEEEITTEKFPENSPSILSLTEKITFGKLRGKTLAAIFREGKAEYLFKTLFAPAAVEGANAKEVEKLRPLIAQTEEYKAYQKEQSMTEEELAASRKPFIESNKLADSLNNLQALGYDAKLLPDGSVAIAATGPAVANKEAIASSGFSYDNKKGWVSKTYERVVSLANLAVSQEAGQPMGAEAVADANIAKIRTEQRDKLADQADQSQPPAGKSARPFMTKAVFEFFKKALSKAFGQEAVKGGKVSIPSNALMEQQWDSMLISKAQADGKPMYLLSSSAGTGKTFVMGAALANIRSRIPEGRIVFVTRSQELIKQVKEDFANFPEVQNIEFITYANLDNKEKKAEFTPSDSDVLIFDEAHEIRYGLSDTSSRSKKAAEWMSKAKFTLLTTATPYESIEQMEYLKATGVFDSLKEVKGLFDDGWFNFASIAGAKVLQREGKPSSIEFDKMSEADKMSGQLYAREFLRKNGMFSQRNAIIPDGMSEANFQSVTGSAKWKELAEAIQAAFKQVKKPSSNDKGFYTNILKRVLEASKEEAAIDLARKEVAEGRQVVIFVETKSETNRDLEEIVEKWDEAQAEYAAAKAVDPAAKFVVPDGVPNLPGVIEMFRNMITAGVTEIKFESAQDKFKRAFGDQAAFYTGDEAGALGQDSLSRWENPDAPNSVPILVATMARGGTGLSLHDTSEGGKYPRTQIMLNLPWRASEVEQVAGRTVRYGMTSVARSFWLFANNLLNESSLASRVGERLKSMNMLVRGEVTLAANKIDNKDWVVNPFTNEVAEQDRSLPTPIGGEMAKDLGQSNQTNLSTQPPSGKVVGGITEQNAKNGLDLIAKLIPMARRMVRLATSAELLADETLTPAERATVRSGAQGYYSKGKVVLITDQVKQTIFHKNADVAAAATILHEMMHHGTSVIRDSKLFYASWLKLVSEYVTDAQIERLVNVQGYSAYADWRTDMAVKEKAMEEIFVRQLEGLFVRKGSLSFVEKNKLQKFFSWLKEFVNSALGLPKGTQIPDSHLEEMGWRFVAAIESAQFVERSQDVRESAPDLGSLPPQNQTSLLSPYTKEEKEALTTYLNSRPDLGLKFGQILGLEDGSIADVQSIAASENLAYEYLQLDADKGRPVVGASDVDRLLGIAAQLTAKGSTFGVNYQQGKPDAATGVLQMVLTQAGLEMARNGDPRLIKMLRQNWNGIVMGAFLTHSSAGRLLQSRSAYKNEILDTMYELEQATKASATKYLQDEGVEDAENVLRSVEELIQKAQLDAQALEALKKTVSGIKVGMQDGLSERIAEALKFTGGEIKRQFTTFSKRVLQLGQKEKLAQDMRDRKAASSASQNFADDLGLDEPLPVYGSLEELEADIAKDRREIAKLGKALEKALGTKPPAPQVSSPAPNIPTADEGAVGDLEDVEDVKEEENKNEATKAAEAILTNLKDFLERKFSKEAKAPSVYAIIKKAVDSNIANTPKHTVFKYFSDDLEKELEPFDIEDSVREELIATAWSTSSRYAEKEAEKITNRFLSKKEVQDNLKTEDTLKLRALVKEFLRNKKKLEEQDFVDTMVPLVQALKVPAEIAKELAMATYGEHLVRKEAALQRMLDRTKASLLAGSRKTLVSQIKAADQADINDVAWQEAALRKVLTLSGILPSELDRAMGVFTEADKASIFGTTLEKMNKVAAENLNKSVERLTKNYEEYLKRPTNAPKPAPSETLRKLVRNLVALDIGRPLFVTQAAAFGATEAQANRLYDLARTERSLREGEGTSTTKMDVLIKYITSDASLQNDPALRLEAIKAWLRNNGYTSQAADNAAAAIDAAFEEQVVAAQMKAMEKFEIKISSRKQAQLKQKAENANVNVAEKQVKKLQELIRMGLGKGNLDPTKSFAKAAGYENLQRSDYKALGELDLKITQAKADQRIHDYAIGVKELYELLARRKLEMGFLARLAISYNNSALSGLGTLAINIIAPMGAMMTRVGLDMGAAITRGDIQAVKDIFKVLQDTASIIKNEVKFSITGGANTNDWSRVIMNATSLQQPLVKAMQKINNPSTTALEKLKARMVVVQSWTDVTRRVLMATDHVWFSMLDNYFRKTQALDVMRRAGVQDQAKIDQVKALLFAGTNIYGPRLAYELNVLQSYETAIEQLRGLPDAKKRILDLVTAPLDAQMKIEARKFEEDIRGDIRRASQGSALTQAKSVKQALGAVRLQRTLSNIRVRDNVARDINLAIKGILPDIQFPDFVEKESAYEMGVHRGEEAPSLDVVNNIVNAIQGAGNNVIQKHPILGRMLLGYFGIPSNLLNRAMWFTPYGLIRYAIAAKTRRDVRVGPNPFYQQSMATNEQIRQRLVEATVGTTAVAILMALKALSDDDDDSPFNVTLIGPTNKTELDAWKKAGHRQGSIEVRVGDKIVSLNAMRGPLEPLKIALLMVGAMDDMRLNRKENDGEFGQYLSEYLTAMLSGWSKQASFFGAKSTIGATLAVNPDASVVSTALYKLNPIIPFSGLISSVEKLMTGGDRFRGREGSIYLNLPIARSLLTQKAVNALGDPQGLNPSSTWTKTNERAWWAGFPLMVSGTPTGNDKKVYEFILDRGIAPGLPQRTALENKNGVMSDTSWQDYVAVRGTFIKRAMIRDLARLRKMDDDSAAKALGQISTDATAAAKKQLRYK